MQSGQVVACVIRVVQAKAIDMCAHSTVWNTKLGFENTVNFYSFFTAAAADKKCPFFQRTQQCH